MKYLLLLQSLLETHSAKSILYDLSIAFILSITLSTLNQRAAAALYDKSELCVTSTYSQLLPGLSLLHTSLFARASRVYYLERLSCGLYMRVSCKLSHSRVKMNVLRFRRALSRADSLYARWYSVLCVQYYRVRAEHLFLDEQVSSYTLSASFRTLVRCIRGRVTQSHLVIHTIIIF